MKSSLRRYRRKWAIWLDILTSPRVDKIVDQRLRDDDTERLAEYGFDTPDVRVVIARRGQATLEFQLAEGSPGDDSYYARTIAGVDETLYLVKKDRLQGIEELASDPLVIPGWEPPEDGEEPQEESPDN